MVVYSGVLQARSQLPVALARARQSANRAWKNFATGPIEGLTLSVEQEHIARWKADPEGIWEIAKVRTDDQDPSGRWVLTRWHPSGERA